MARNSLSDLARNVSRSSWCVPVLFVWYLVYAAATGPSGASKGPGWLPIVLGVFLKPLVLAGVLTGIAKAAAGERARFGAFFKDGMRLYPAFFGVGILTVIISVGLVAALSGMRLAGDPESSSDLARRMARLLMAFLLMPWLSVIAVDRGKVFRGLLRSMGLFASGWLVPALCVLWVAAVGADDYAQDVISKSVSQKPALLIVAGMELVTALVAAAAYNAVIMRYSAVKTMLFGEPVLSTVPEAPGGPAAVYQRAVASPSWLVITSVLPVLSIAALASGISTLSKNRGRSIRSLLACGLGALFTAGYLLAVVGILLPSRGKAKAPGYQFLAEEQPAIKGQVALLDSGQFETAVEQLRAMDHQNGKQPWAYYCALGIGRAALRDTTQADQMFRTALAMSPLRSEFYYHYGLALLKMGNRDAAMNMLERAQQHEPRLENLQAQIALARNAFKPSRGVSATWYILILFTLFTFHEFAHAYVAHKLGDDTAANQGRLTLNPLVHLDLIGSVLLPGILLWRGSETVFGWARPVPVDTQRFKDPLKDDMLVSFAGPGMNLLIAIVAMVAFMVTALILKLWSPDALSLNLATPYAMVSLAGPGLPGWLVFPAAFLKELLYTSVVLGFLNLLPIPPLDGARILAGFLPEKGRQMLERVQKFSIVIIVGLMMTPVLDYVLVIPVIASWSALAMVFTALGLS